MRFNNYLATNDGGILDLKLSSASLPSLTELIKTEHRKNVSAKEAKETISLEYKNELMIKIPVNQIQQITFEKQRSAPKIGFLIGLAIDVSIFVPLTSWN